MALTGCMSGNDSVVTDVSPKSWETPAAMVYTNRDTLSERRATLFIRHDHRTRSGRYTICFRAPSGTVVRLDTLSVEIKEEYSIPPKISMNIAWPYRRRIHLAEEGDYDITVTPLQTTAGIWSVGIDFN